MCHDYESQEHYEDEMNHQAEADAEMAAMQAEAEAQAEQDKIEADREAADIEIENINNRIYQLEEELNDLRFRKHEILRSVS